MAVAVGRARASVDSTPGVRGARGCAHSVRRARFDGSERDPEGGLWLRMSAPLLRGSPSGDLLGASVSRDDR